LQIFRLLLGRDDFGELLAGCAPFRAHAFLTALFKRVLFDSLLIHWTCLYVSFADIQASFATELTLENCWQAAHSTRARARAYPSISRLGPWCVVEAHSPRQVFVG